MRVISKKPLRIHWERHSAAQAPLKKWLKTVEKARWGSFADIRKTFATRVDRVGTCYIFDVHGGHGRVIAKISRDWTILFVRRVLSHAEYDLGRWKAEC